jgi:hypothetical protein
VVQVSELLQEHGELCIVMEYLEGETLSMLRQALAKKGATLPPALACWAVAEAAAGLHAAHELEGPDGAPLGLVHRDMSPQNVFVGYDGTVKLLDFGVAHARGRLTRTESGLIKGKLEYMSPEQAKGVELDRRSDIFSLGVVLWEALTGRTLFRRPSALAIAQAIAEEPITPPSRVTASVPSAVDGICLKALARAPGARHQTAAELRKELLGQARSENDPGAALAALMRACFPEHIAEKAEMIRNAREGASRVEVRPEEIEISLDEAPLPRAPRRSKLAFALGGAALLGFFAAIAYVSSPAHEAPPTVVTEAHAAPAPVAPAPPPAPPEPPAPAWVMVKVVTRPAGAKVELDGRAAGLSPVELKVPRGDGNVQIIARKAGFRPSSSTITPQGDQTLVVNLVAAARRKPGEAPDPLEQKW